MSRGMPATGIETSLSQARLSPAVGEQSRQALSCRLRGFEECPTWPEYQTNNADEVRDRQQVIDLRSGVRDVWQLAPGVHFTERLKCKQQPKQFAKWSQQYRRKKR